MRPPRFGLSVKGLVKQGSDSHCRPGLLTLASLYTPICRSGCKNRCSSSSSQETFLAKTPSQANQRRALNSVSNPQGVRPFAPSPDSVAVNKASLERCATREQPLPPSPLRQSQRHHGPPGPLYGDTWQRKRRRTRYLRGPTARRLGPWSGSRDDVLEVPDYAY
jgi:hypothetical protein